MHVIHTGGSPQNTAPDWQREPFTVEPCHAPQANVLRVTYGPLMWFATVTAPPAHGLHPEIETGRVLILDTDLRKRHDMAVFEWYYQTEIERLNRERDELRQMYTHAAEHRA